MAVTPTLAPSGHVIQNPKDYPYSLTRDEALELLAQDVVHAENTVLRLISAPLTDGQFDALVSFTFNLGAGALQSSTLRRKVNREEHDDVPHEFMRWRWAGGKKLKGLISRRKAEALMYQIIRYLNRSSYDIISIIRSITTRNIYKQSIFAFALLRSQDFLCMRRKIPSSWWMMSRRFRRCWVFCWTCRITKSSRV